MVIGRYGNDEKEVTFEKRGGFIVRLDSPSARIASPPTNVND